MTLRDHPLTSHKGLRSWPPIWVCIDDNGKGILEGEFGTLRSLGFNDRHECRISLRMNYRTNEYLGHLIFKDKEFFCMRVYEALQQNMGKPIKEIGGLDVGDAPAASARRT